MSRGVTLDRRKRYEVAHGVGIPTASTKGNVYISDTDGSWWIRAEGDIWKREDIGDFWVRNSGGILSPTTSGDGIAVSTTEGKSITLATSGDGTSAGVINIISNGTDVTSGGNISVVSQGAKANINITASGGNADIDISTSGASGDFTLSTGGTSGDIAISTNGTSSGDIDITTAGARANFTFISSGTIGNFAVNTSLSGQGDVSFFTSLVASHGYFKVDSRQMQLNGRDGTLISNAAFGDVGYPDGGAFIKVPSQSSTSNPLHLYSDQSDIMLETIAAACENDIIFKSSDNIIGDAEGGISFDCAFTSNFTITAADLADQTLTLSAVNSGAGNGIIDLVSDVLHVNGTLGVSGSGSTITVVNGIVTAIS